MHDIFTYKKHLVYIMAFDVSDFLVEAQIEHMTEIVQLLSYEYEFKILLFLFLYLLQMEGSDASRLTWPLFSLDHCYTGSA